MFDDKTQNNILEDLKAAVDPDTNTEEGSLVDHSLRGAAAEFEQAYVELGVIEKNGYAQTADREHLILRAKERGIEPLPASNAVWKAECNVEIALNTRFSAGELTYICTGEIEPKKYRLMCEQAGTRGNARQEGLAPIEYIDGFESGELTELLKPARDDETTEDFRARYISIVTDERAFGGNRAQYKAMMHGIDGVGACKIQRVTKGERKIRIYFLDSTFKTPNEALVSDVQEMVDPVGKQGEGEGLALIFHVVDIYPCMSKVVNIEANITVDTGYVWEDLLPDIREKVDAYFLDLAKGWESEEYLTVRILKVNAAIAGVEGIVDVQATTLNGVQENLLLNPNEIPVRGVIACRP